MIKRSLFAVILIGLLQGSLLGQQIKVLGTVTVIDRRPQIFTSPQFSPDGRQILFSEFGYKGLWLYDLANQKCIQLNDLPGAGYAPVISPDGTNIYFWTDDYQNYRRYSSLAVQSMADKQIKYLIKAERHIFPVAILNDETIVYRQNKELKTVSRTEKANLLNKPVQTTVGYVEGQKIIILTNGSRRELTPFGLKNYIWFSLSPDKSKMLFTVPGGGTFICDLEGNVLVRLGKANAPRWSPDGRWICYMLDQDDGHTYTASDIWAASSDGHQKFQLTTTTDEIEMYPAWSPQMDKLVFETFSGKIAYLNIEIKQ